MCMADYGERSDVWTETAHKARKVYWCDECGRAICPGEHYVKCKSLYGRHWTTLRVCQHCEIAMNWLGKNCGGYLVGAMGYDLREHAREYPALAHDILRFDVGYRQRWKQFADKAKLMPLPRMPRSIQSLMDAKS